MNKKNFLLLLISHLLIGIGFFYLYIHHVRSIFETRTNFAHLTKLERESLLRKEDALYYAFYKTIAEESTFLQGYGKLLNYTTIEYPNSVNVVNRFHVLPEIFISFIYHNVKYISQKLNIPIISCWAVETDNLHEPAMTCDGLGEPFTFYLEFVWLLGGFTVFLMYMYGTFLSENIFGGIYAVVLYIIFHKNASKIYERPVARENFAFPFILWQIFYLCICIDRASKEKPRKTKLRPLMILKLTSLTTISLLCWQFSSVIYATQILIMISPWNFDLVPSWCSIDYTISQFISNILAYYFSYENKKYFLSWQNGPAIALFCISLMRVFKSRSRPESIETTIRNVSLSISLSVSFQGTLTDLLEKSGYVRPEDNPFTVYRDLIFHWSLQQRANFTTSLLACNSDYVKMEINDVFDLLKTLFIKPYCLYGVVVLAKFFRKWRVRELVETRVEDIERAKKYVLEDFLETNHITMKEMSNKDTENELNDCLRLLEECGYDYEKYKIEKKKTKKQVDNEHDDFINNIKKLKDQINENERKKEQQTLNQFTPDLDKENEIDNKNPKLSDQTSPTDSSEPTTSAETKKSNNSEPDGPSPSANSKPKTTSTSTSKTKKKSRKHNTESQFSYHYLYSVAQLAIFSVIGFYVNKLFFLCFTQGCVIAPTLCSKFWFNKQRSLFWSISLAVFITSIVNPGVQNLYQEYFPTQSTNDDLHSMLEWINLNTEKDAVFGGPIEIIGTVHLATQRPIVNHPNLDMREISERTEGIYSIYSRQQSSDIYTQCSQMKIQYLILSFEDCAEESESSDNDCDILRIWDEMQPTYRKFPQFCAELTKKNIPSFLKVFSNGYYGIIKMFSQSVQLNLKQSKMTEEIM